MRFLIRLFLSFLYALASTFISVSILMILDKSEGQFASLFIFFTMVVTFIVSMVTLKGKDRRKDQSNIKTNEILSSLDTKDVDKSMEKILKENESLKRQVSLLQALKKGEIGDKLQEFNDEILELREFLGRKSEDFDEEKLRAQLQIWKESAESFANFYIRDLHKNICKKVSPNNYESSKNALERGFERLRKYNITFDEADKVEFGKELKKAFADALRKEEARQEQARIKEMIREEKRAERELQKELERIENEEKAIQKAIAEVLKVTNDQHSIEIEKLKAQLEELKSQSERAMSQAQLTKSGHVYVISNLGSFGEDYYKVGMTRRLDPMDRVKELGDASVPFSFDVHMMISCDDAPTLEKTLHKELHNYRANKVNLRKEFFKVELDKIVSIVEMNHGIVDYVADKEAFDYRETLLIEERGDYDDYFNQDEIDQASTYDDELEEIEEVA